MPLTRLIAILLLLTSQAAPALTLPSWMRFLKRPEATQAAKQRVSVGHFTGGTGSSARKTLLAALEVTHELLLTEEDPHYLISGTSIGGASRAELLQRMASPSWIALTPPQDWMKTPVRLQMT